MMKSVDRRLARAEGQIRGIRKMIDGGEYCMDILVQINAARSALDKAGAELVAGHIESCIVGHDGENPHPQAQKMSTDELINELRDHLAKLF